MLLAPSSRVKPTKSNYHLAQMSILYEVYLLRRVYIIERAKFAYSIECGTVQSFPRIIFKIQASPTFHTIKRPLLMTKPLPNSLHAIQSFIWYLVGKHTSATIAVQDLPERVEIFSRKKNQEW